MGWARRSRSPCPQDRKTRPRARKRSTARGPAVPVESDERILVVDDNGRHAPLPPAHPPGQLEGRHGERWHGRARQGAQVPARSHHCRFMSAAPGPTACRCSGCYETTRAWRISSSWRVAAGANEDASIDALSAGADDYPPKPFAARELLARGRAAGAQPPAPGLRCRAKLAEQPSFMKDELVLMLSNCCAARSTSCSTPSR